MPEALKIWTSLCSILGNCHIPLPLACPWETLWPLLSNQIWAQCTLDQVVRELRKKTYTFFFFVYVWITCLWVNLILPALLSTWTCVLVWLLRPATAFSHLPEAWEMHSLSSSPLYSPHGSGFVACCSMGSPSFWPFLVFSHSAARLQIHCAISVFCNPAARFPSQLPLGTYKNKFAQSSTLWPTLSSSTNLDFIIISWPQYKSMAQTGKLDFQILTNRQQMLRPQTKGLQISYT